MTHKQDRPAGFGHVPHFPQALFLEGGIAHRQHFVDQQDLRLQVGGDGKGQAHLHPGAVMLEGGIDELLDLGKGHDFVELA